MKKVSSLEVKLINVQADKDTHGLFVDGLLYYLGTETECTFRKLMIQKLQKIQLN